MWDNRTLSENRNFGEAGSVIAIDNDSSSWLLTAFGKEIAKNKFNK